MKMEMQNNVLFIPAFTGLGAPYSGIQKFEQVSDHRTLSRTDLINAAFNSITYRPNIIDCLIRSGIKIESLNVDRHYGSQ